MDPIENHHQTIPTYRIIIEWELHERSLYLVQIKVRIFQVGKKVKLTQIWNEGLQSKKKCTLLFLLLIHPNRQLISNRHLDVFVDDTNHGVAYVPYALL